MTLKANPPSANSAVSKNFQAFVTGKGQAASAAQAYSAVRHELGTPIAGIRTCAMSLHRGDLGSLTEMQQEFVSYIKEYSETLDRMLRQYLEYVHLDRVLDPQHFQEVNLSLMLKTKLSIFTPDAQLKNVEVRFSEETEEARVYGESERLGRVFDYLIQNAVQHAPSGGNILLRIFRKGGSAVSVEIRDNGTGIPKEDQGRLFEPFMRVSDVSPHRGVSLALAKKIIELHGGSISVESDHGQGASFTVELPSFYKKSGAV